MASEYPITPRKRSSDAFSEDPQDAQRALKKRAIAPVNIGEEEKQRFRNPKILETNDADTRHEDQQKRKQNIQDDIAKLMKIQADLVDTHLKVLRFLEKHEEESKMQYSPSY